MAIDALVDAAKLVGTMKAQDPPPALLGRRRLSPVPMHQRLAEPKLGNLGVELERKNGHALQSRSARRMRFPNDRDGDFLKTSR
jgi:hypothetical protein